MCDAYNEAAASDSSNSFAFWNKSRCLEACLSFSYVACREPLVQHWGTEEQTCEKERNE